MKYCWSTLRVRDLDESIRFYSEIIGLKIQRKINQGDDIEICFLGEGETKIELINDNEYNSDCTGEGISIGFEIESLDEFIDFLKEKSIKVHSGPFSPNPNIRFLYITDPNGYKVQIVEKK
ncbi:MAG TPA: VOC family protein [Tissierellaceae bacterium]|nr:VOC family protein [Tissierellaceae bacterium]